MSTPDFFRSRLDAMIDLRHPLAVLTGRLRWDRLEAALAPKFEHQDRPAVQATGSDLLGEYEVQFGGGVSAAGRPRLSIRLMASLVYLKNSFNLSDEEVVQRWSENVYWQYFVGPAKRLQPAWILAIEGKRGAPDLSEIVFEEVQSWGI